MCYKDRFFSLQVLEPDDGCMYAVSQGAMAVECRENDDVILSLLSSLQHHDSTIECVAERAFLKALVREQTVNTDEKHLPHVYKQHFIHD